MPSPGRPKLPYRKTPAQNQAAYMARIRARTPLERIRAALLKDGKGLANTHQIYTPDEQALAEQIQEMAKAVVELSAVLNKTLVARLTHTEASHEAALMLDKLRTGEQGIRFAVF